MSFKATCSMVFRSFTVVSMSSRFSSSLLFAILFWGFFLRKIQVWMLQREKKMAKKTNFFISFHVTSLLSENNTFFSLIFCFCSFSRTLRFTPNRWQLSQPQRREYNRPKAIMLDAIKNIIKKKKKKVDKETLSPFSSHHFRFIFYLFLRFCSREIEQLVSEVIKQKRRENPNDRKKIEEKNIVGNKNFVLSENWSKFFSFSVLNF